MMLRNSNYLIFVALFLSFAAETVSAATIQRCSAATKSCDVRLEEGFVGDQVSILNDRAQPVATGWIVRREGTAGTIKLKEVFRDVKRGYPVIVNIDSRGKKARSTGSRI